MLNALLHILQYEFRLLKKKNRWSRTSECSGDPGVLHTVLVPELRWTNGHILLAFPEAASRVSKVETILHFLKCK